MKTKLIKDTDNPELDRKICNLKNIISIQQKQAQDNINILKKLEEERNFSILVVC